MWIQIIFEDMVGTQAVSNLRENLSEITVTRLQITRKSNKAEKEEHRKYSFNSHAH